MEEDIELLYKLYAKDVYRYVFSICSDKNLSDDILQNTFIAAMKSIEQFKGKSSVKTWLFSIAKYQCYQQMKKTKIHIAIDEIEMEASGNIIDLAVTNACSQDIMEHIYKLDELNKRIMLLRIIEGLSFSQIGKLVGKSENFCRVAYYRAKNRIRKELIEYE